MHLLKFGSVFALYTNVQRQFAQPGPSLIPSSNFAGHRARFARFLSSKPERRNTNFVANFIENIKDELRRNKELQENKKLLEERLKQLNDSEVRRKYEKISKESAESTDVIKHHLKEFTDHINSVVSNVKDSKLGQDAIQQLKIAAETAERVAQQVGEMQACKQVSYVAKEIDRLADVRMYRRPDELKLRTSPFYSTFSNRTVEANPEATGIELHKESRWYAGWKAFTESNSYYNKVLDWKTRIDESENVFVRTMRGTLERVQLAFESKDNVSEVLTAISKIDPEFDKMEWLRFCEKEMIPNILEATYQMNFDVLQDWCYEKAFNMIANVIKEYAKIGFHTRDSRIIDVSKVELVTGNMTDQGPTLVIQFQVFMINVVKNSEGKVVQGDPDKAVRVRHIWVICRDMEEFNPATAWKLLELHMVKEDLFL
uniref:Mitochondrial import inner membrane translocase subunit TIM44 n=1 Tax=Globodera rostochiensis TaxID=31243 RepID=A0A914GRI0_GLORO